jgi:hypothetical protein
MSRDNYEEFPELTPQAHAALCRANHCLDVSKPGWNRRYLSAFLLEAMNQADDWEELEAIANNLHSPLPPPPPTLAQAREANLLSQEGRDVVCAFLMSLGEVDQ